MTEQTNGPISIGDRVRVEATPLRKREKATEALLSDDVTARHYQVGKPDAFGKPIKIGSEMGYIDWKNPERVWQVYALDEETGRFMPHGEPIVDHQAALSAGATLAAELAK